MNAPRCRSIRRLEADSEFLCAASGISSLNPEAGRTLAHEKLDEVFRWKESRVLSMNLTIHYNRFIHLVESSPEALNLDFGFSGGPESQSARRRLC